MRATNERPPRSAARGVLGKTVERGHFSDQPSGAVLQHIALREPQ
jgi:hypothetical protein